MPNREIDGGYRYAFQGQEKDPETGKEAFKLRLWDGRIGRWLTTDPKNQFWSPYLGMGNNPTNGVDPDGGKFFTQWLDGDGNVVHDDGIDNGIIYRVNDGFSFTGNIDALTANSRLIVNNWNFVGSDSDLLWLVKSQFNFVDGFSIDDFTFNPNSVGGKHAFSVSPLVVDDFDNVSKKTGKINFDINKRAGKTLGNVYNIRSALEHELGHINQGLLGAFYYGLDKGNIYFHGIREHDAYHRQMNGKWFSKTPKWFQESTKNALWKHFEKPFLEKGLNMKLPDNRNQIWRN